LSTSIGVTSTTALVRATTGRPGRTTGSATAAGIATGAGGGSGAGLLQLASTNPPVKTKAATANRVDNLEVM